jgi:hypothetical protein
MGNKTMLCHPRAEDWITSPQIPSRLREARQIAAIIAKLPELPRARANKQNRIAFGHNVPLAMHKKRKGPGVGPGPL